VDKKTSDFKHFLKTDLNLTPSTSSGAGTALKGRPVGGGGSVDSNNTGGTKMGRAGIGKALPQPSFISKPMISFPVKKKVRQASYNYFM